MKKCEICGDQDAIIHVQQIIGNEIIDLHLCGECAGEKGISANNDKIELSLANLFDGLLATRESGKRRTENAECPECGTKLKDLRKKGRVGCTECYSVFRREINRYLENMSGSARHTGKIPKQLLRFKKILIDREVLKNRLKDAVDREDYETAAVIRDKIKAIGDDTGEVEC